jgi:hypothetical protein
MPTTKRGRVVYVCRVCHRVYARSQVCHCYRTARCDAGAPGDERSQPLFDAHGHIVTRAPRWWVEACFAQKSKTKSKK